MPLNNIRSLTLQLFNLAFPFNEAPLCVKMWKYTLLNGMDPHEIPQKAVTVTASRLKSACDLMQIETSRNSGCHFFYKYYRLISYILMVIINANA